MKIKSKRLRRFILKLICIFREFTAHLLFFFAWNFYIRWVVSKDEEYKGKIVWNQMFNCTTLKDYEDRLREYKWTSDAFGGLYDITYYNKPWLNFVPKIVEKFGRDCDDFAYLTYHWMSRMGYSEVYVILTMDDDVKSGHFIVVGKNTPETPYIIKSNSYNSVKISGKDLNIVIETYLKLYNDSKDIVWCVYRKEMND